MKKALALFMALVMICSVVATLSTVSATGAQAAPVLDGVISDGEYTYSVTTNVNDLSAGAKSEVQGTEVVEYFAYNATYLYYGIVFTQTADNRACWPQMKVNNTFNVYSNETGTVNYYHSRAALQARYLEDGTTKNNGISAPAGGTTPVFNTDMFVTAAKDANNVKTYEFKFARAYFAANAGCEAADVRVVPMWTWFHDQTSTAHILTAEDMLNLEDAGVGTINDFGQGGTMYNFVVLDSEAKDETYENLANELGLVYYVGEPVAEEPIPEPDPYTEINLEKLYGATYVGKALTEEDAKPVQDGVIGENEYQAMYFVSEDGSKDVMRRGAKTDLRNDYKEYIAHDAEWIYFAAEFDNVTTDTRGRFYWNLFFLENFEYEYNGGSTANGAFVQNGKGIKNGWLYGGEIKADIAEGYSERSNSVTSGTAPVVGTDVYVGVGKEDLGESEWTGWYNGHQVYEFKVSKAWYAAQAGLASAEEVVNLAWITMGQQINHGGSAYTQIGHVPSADVLAALAANGAEYKANGENADLNDDKVLPRLFILDDAPEGYYEVDTQVTASARVSSTNPGLRFKTKVDKDYLDNLVATYGEANVKVGTLIAPTDKLIGDLTIDTNTKVDVAAIIDMPFAQTEDTYTFAGSITNIKPQNLTRDFTAVGYVAYSADGQNWTYVYSVSEGTRNVTEIAQAALDAGEFAGNETAIGILKDLGAVAAE